MYCLGRHLVIAAPFFSLAATPSDSSNPSTASCSRRALRNAWLDT